MAEGPVAQHPTLQVTGSTVRYILDAMAAVEPGQVGSILERVGLKHLATVPADQTRVASNGDLARVYASAYQVLGETMMRVFLSRYGEAVCRSFLGSPDGKDLLARTAAQPADLRVGYAVKDLAERMSQTVYQTRFSEDAEACYVDVVDCLTCDGIRHARAPYCASIETLFSALAREVTGKRASCLEVACRAMGAASCCYRLWKT
jgi:predicted hydrocarbon binding protein